ncbi:MAG: hypothetical protein HRU17_17020 [Polyangiaceae bacterium]|nr:hypothetical protein [Polyangiaceae bacterium]
MAKKSEEERRRAKKSEEERRRVLFVDDEQAIISALRVCLRFQRRRWDMDFALGGQAAMDMVGTTHLDAVVSDMAMPGSTVSSCLSSY